MLTRGPSVRSAASSEPIFGACLVIVAVHAAAAGLLLPGGTSALLRVAMLSCAILGPPALLVWYAHEGRVARVMCAGLVGLGATVAGLATSIPHAVLAGPRGTDYTGLPATVAGAVLIGLAFRDALRGRRPAVKIGLGILAAFAVGQWLIAPAVNVGLVTNASRADVPSAATIGLAGAREESFAASDGIRLDGWYVPGRNGATVIVLHGSHGTRMDTLAHLRMLVAAGYGALAFDARGHGRSAGPTNALGWTGARDIAGAIGFLAHRCGVDPSRIAALGLSMGAEEALRAAATGIPLAAVVADGAGASTLADETLTGHGLGPVLASFTWLTMRGTELVSGESEPAGLNRIVGRIRVPVLLIASKATGERTIDAIYRDRIGHRASLWYVPEAGHTGGLRARPSEYTARVSAFLARALRARVQ